MVRSWLLLGVLVGATACEITPEERANRVCTALCVCEAGALPALQDRCVVKCEDEIGASSVSDSCLSCIEGNNDRCATLESTCKPICQPPSPVEDGGFPL